MKRPLTKLKERARRARRRRSRHHQEPDESILGLLDFGRDHDVGAPPGLVGEEQGASANVRVIRFNEREFEHHPEATVRKAIALCETDWVTWIDIIGVRDIATMQALRVAFDLHPLALEDVGQLNQRTKVEDYKNFDFVILKSIAVGASLETEQIAMFLFDNVVITFQERDGDCFEQVRERLRTSKGRIRARGADYLLYSLVDALVDSLYPTLEAFGEELDALEDELLDHPDADVLARLHAMRRQLLALRKATWPLRDTVAALARENHVRILPDTTVYLRDTQDHVMQVIDMIETFREVAGGLIDLYMSGVSNRLNEVMGLLTIVTTVFVPLSFLTGLYGMNFDTSQPGNMPELSIPYAYPVVLLMMAVLSLGLLWVFRKRGWLKWSGR